MERKITIMIGILMIMSFGFAQESHCLGQCHDKAMHDKEPLMKMQMLDLTAEQRAEIEASKYEIEKKTIQLRSDIELKQLDFRKEMNMDNPNRNKLMNLTKDISELQLKLKQLMLDHKLRVHSILTPEQRKQMKQHLPQQIIEKKIIKKQCEGDFKH